MLEEKPKLCPKKSNKNMIAAMILPDNHHGQVP
jgi:hypothetical protein